MAKSGQQHTKADEGGQRPAEDQKKSSSESSKTASTGQGTGKAQPGTDSDKKSGSKGGADRRG